MGIIRKRRWSEYWAGLWRWAFVSGLSYDVIWAYCINSFGPFEDHLIHQRPLFLLLPLTLMRWFFFHSNCVSDVSALWWWLILAPQ